MNLPQFEKYVPKRKDARNPVILEHLRIDKELKDLKKEGKIDQAMYNKLHTVGSQPGRLYGLAKVHKDVIPLRPVLSMLGTAYHKIADHVQNGFQLRMSVKFSLTPDFSWINVLSILYSSHLVINLFSKKPLISSICSLCLSPVQLTR